MISDNDLASAVSAGIINQETADALRSHSSSLRATPQADEENFRLVSSFNDIFVALAGGLFLFGIGWFGAGIFGGGTWVFAAAAAWGLSEFFTLKRRMAFPSIVFFLVFVICVTAGISYFVGHSIGLFTAFAASFAHWRRFQVPIAVAGCAGCVVMGLVSIVRAALPDVEEWAWLMLVLGLAVFAYALYWDKQDRDRITRKSDVAFWLHLLAAPMIVHPIFTLMGFDWTAALGFGGGDEMGEVSATMLAVLAVAVYIILGIVAVIIDRRAMLVSALAYVITALIYLISQIGMTSSNLALAIILIGSALLLLSAFWQNLRGWMIPKLPQSWTVHLPPAKIEAR